MRAASRSMRSIEASTAAGLLARKPDRRLQAGERRAQLVRDVVQQPPLSVHQLLELRGRAIKVATEVRELVASAPHAVADADVEVALRRRVERAAETADRFRDIPGEQGGDDEACEHTADDRLDRKGRSDGRPGPPGRGAGPGGGREPCVRARRRKERTSARRRAQRAARSVDRQAHSTSTHPGQRLAGAHVRGARGRSRRRHRRRARAPATTSRAGERNAGSPSRCSVAAAESSNRLPGCGGDDSDCAARLRWRSQIAVETPTTVVTCASMKTKKNFQNRRPTAYSLISW